MIVGLDWDGTCSHTPHGIDMDDAQALLAHCRPNQAVLDRCVELSLGGHELVVITARGPHVAHATAAQVDEWIHEAGGQVRHIRHRPRLLFDMSHYVPDKEASLRELGVEIYIGDRREDRAAALRAGARFLWPHQLVEHGLAAPQGA